MKAIKVVFGFLMVLAVISGSVVVAQEVDPPRETLPPEQQRPFVPPDITYRTQPGVVINVDPVEDLDRAEAEKLLEMESLGMVSDLPFMEEQPVPVIPQVEIPLGASDEESAVWEMTDPSQEGTPIYKEDLPGELEGESRNTVYPQTGTINIATTTANEWWPAVAHGGNYYMVVYVLDYNIIAKVYSNTGAYLHTYTVANLVNNCSYPTITYDASSGLFVVAYQHAFSPTDTDILAQAVSPLTGNQGSYVYLAISTLNEWWPSVACNPVGGSCLMAYAYNISETIRGRYFTVSNSGIASVSISTYNLTNADNGWFPHLAWGKGTGTYMVTYNWNNGSGEIFPMYTHVHDTPVVGDKYLHGNAYVVRSDFFGTNRNKYNYDVAFDPCTQRYVVSFHYDFSTGDHDVYAVAKHATIATGASPFSVASTDQNETMGAISFVTDDHLTAACGSMDKLVVVYNNASVGTKAVDLRGNNSSSNPLYDRDPSILHLVVEGNWLGFNSMVETAISSGPQGAQLFLAFELLWVPAWGGDNDIMGRLVEVRERSYIPLLTR